MFDRVYLTGFKKFGDHDVNPTQMLAEHFATLNISGLTCSVIEVTVEDVDSYINKTKQLIAQKLNQRVLNLHFGVGPNQIYKLQTCAYNNKDFGIPDNNGNQFFNQKICPAKDLDMAIKCTQDLRGLVDKLGSEFQIVQSVNPGRYICNYIYFKSLYELSCVNNSCSLFIHFPIHYYKSHQENIKFVESVLGLCLKKQ